jgi:hypothetical protein
VIAPYQKSIEILIKKYVPIYTVHLFTLLKIQWTGPLIYCIMNGLTLIQLSYGVMVYYQGPHSFDLYF